MAQREIWKTIPGYEGYEASNLGRIRAINRHIIFKWGQHHLRRFMKGKVLAPSKDPGGYLSLELGRGKKRRVHCLILLTFKGPCGKGQEVRHRDGNRLNNRLENLHYGTRKENVSDMVRHGTAWWLNAKNFKERNRVGNRAR